MLSEEKVSPCFARLDRKPLEAPATVRLKFRKVGTLQYVSHLDLQRTFGRVLIRAGIPLWYTQGFNPHPKLVFAMPLSIGTESVCELLDVRIDREIGEDEILTQLNRCLTEELCILEAYRPERKFSEICYAEYEILIHTAGVTEELAREVQAYLTTSPVWITRKGKAGERQEDLVSSVYRLEVSVESGDLVLRMVLTAGEGAMNPEFPVSVLRQRFGLLSGNPLEERYSILRKRFLLSDGETEFR